MKEQNCVNSHFEVRRAGITSGKKVIKMAVITNFLVLLVYGVMLGAGAGSNQVIEESQCSLDRNDEALHCFLR